MMRGKTEREARGRGAKAVPPAGDSFIEAFNSITIVYNMI